MKWYVLQNEKQNQEEKHDYLKKIENYYFTKRPTLNDNFLSFFHFRQKTTKVVLHFGMFFQKWLFMSV